MTQLNLPVDPERLVRDLLEAAGMHVISVEGRRYPEETIFIARVPAAEFEEAAKTGMDIDRELQARGFNAFVTVRSDQSPSSVDSGKLENGISDPRATQLVNLLSARSRTSEIQPSLSYVPDAAQNILRASTPRHHLIFGRRGAGKTALMVETRRVTESAGALSVWVNVQALRSEPAERAFLWVLRRTLETLQVSYTGVERAPAVLTSIAALLGELDDTLRGDVSEIRAQRFVPKTQAVLRRFLDTNAKRLFIFLDDLHYLPRIGQPKLLDMLHGVVRDSDAWLKIASIRHLTRWFQPTPPVGLQTGHDADHIDLDVTLENPTEAKTFLEKVLRAYAKYVGINSLLAVFSQEALDRLVLASGAVPRDYLVLSAGAIRQAQRREKSRIVGVQDVNKAAGETAKGKIAELEDDAAAAEGTTLQIANALQAVRAFCLDEKRFTYFRIDFRDKEAQPSEYGLMQHLMDLRLIHLVNSSLSDERHAGRRSEVFMLDLSQFSGERFKKNLRVLDFVAGHLVLKVTGTVEQVRRGDTPKKLLGLLRRGPQLHLEGLSQTV